MRVRGKIENPAALPPLQDVTTLFCRVCNSVVFKVEGRGPCHVVQQCTRCAAHYVLDYATCAPFVCEECQEEEEKP